MTIHPKPNVETLDLAYIYILRKIEVEGEDSNSRPNMSYR